MRALLPVSAVLVAVAFVACGGSNKPAEEPAPLGATTATTAATAPAAPPCVDAPLNPVDVIAKEPQVVSACLATPPTLEGQANLCGQAKIAVEVGKDGRVTRAEVASSSLPAAVTECIKARLAAMQYACPKAGTATYTVPVGLPIGTPTGACPGLPAGTTGSP